MKGRIRSRANRFGVGFAPVVALGIALVFGAGCGSSTPASRPSASAGAAAAAAAEDLPPLPRSSIAAVILHRDELRLDDDQVKALQSLDEELAERVKAMSEKPAGGPRPDGGVAHRGGDRLHMMGSRGGAPRGTAGGGFHGTPSGAPKGIRSPQQRADDADTQAYLQAEEEILAPPQRDRAREIAEKYREDLYDRRSRTGDDSNEK